MTTPAEPNPTESLQFDTAEVAPTAGRACAVCKALLVGEYFEAGASLVCRGCHDRFRAGLSGGSSVARAAKALGLGAAGGAVGAAVYYGVTEATGWNIGLISVLLGWLVGAGVRKGADARGGWFYQAMAIGLTYLALSAMAVPGISSAMDQNPPDGGAADALASGPIRWIFVFVISLASPVLAAFDSPLSALIHAFAIYEAWKMNKRETVHLAGPFQLSALTTPDALVAEKVAEPQGEQKVG